jgi:hypothetical protein
MTAEQEQIYLLRYLAKKVKELYRESLVFQKVSDTLREDVPVFAEIVADTRKSHEIEVQVALFEIAIDAKIPPISEESLNREAVEMIQALGLDRGTHH